MHLVKLSCFPTLVMTKLKYYIERFNRIVSDFEIQNTKTNKGFVSFQNIFLFGRKLNYRIQHLEKIAFWVDTDSLLILEEMVVLALAQALPRPGLPSSSAGVTARSPV